MKKSNLLFTLGIILCCNACQKQNKTMDTNTNQPAASLPFAPQVLPDGTHCFEYRVGQDVTTVRFVVSGNDISGEMNWIPFEKDSGRGTLKGTQTSSEITATWTYIIEGSNQTEEVIFKMEGEQLMRKTGELVDEKNDGNLKLKDPASAQYSETYTKVACS